MTRFLTFFLATFSLAVVNAQVYEGAEASKRLQEAEILRINPATNQVQYALLSSHSRIYASGITDYFTSVYKLKSPYGFSLLKKEADELGFEHLRYQLTYNNIPILGSILIAHLREGKLNAFNGEVFKLQHQLSKPILTEALCLQKALDSTGAELYMWQVPEEEDIIREIKEDKTATWYPDGELVFCPDKLDFRHGIFHLAYKFTIHAAKPRSAGNIYVDAMTGEIIARENLLHTTDVPGKAITKYSGTVTIITDSTAPYNYRLRENTRGGGVYTYNMKKGTNYGTSVDFKDSNNVWNNVNGNKDEVATDAHWGAEMTYDYYKNRHGRSSYNNNNARINSFVHYANGYDNAFWDGVRMTYGDGNTFKPLTSLDVCGHEITHAVTSNSAGLIYSYESGQLNESFSDMFGNAIERYGKPNNYSWIIGEEITADGTGLRNMKNPKNKGNPRCYKGTYWYFGSGDNGGVHLNSGVQNWWFYLISEGGSGTNDFSATYSVDSIGIQKAEKIAYRNLTVYLTPTSEYADARFYSIRAATDLYGNCSREVIAVTNAWYACNVGAQYDSGFIKADFRADTMVCSASKQVNFTNLSTNSGAAIWSFGDASFSSIYNPVHNYTGYGSYTIKLKVQSCFKNKWDSITKTAYVKIDSTFDICNSVLLPAGGSDSTQKCQTFVYDEGGEGDYTNSKTTLYRLSAPGADSMRLKFKDFDYEFGFDSLYIYKGKYPGGTLIGGYTGSTLPFTGKNYTIAGNMVTLKHVADPGVVGRGFKLFYTALKKPVNVTAYADTMICKGNSVLLYAKGTGGYKKDYHYQWKGIKTDDSIIVAPLTQTVYKVYLTDVCTKSRDSALVTVKVRDALDVTANKDTTICMGQSIGLKAIAAGGRSSNYQFTWNNGLGNSSTHTVTPLTSTTYRVILSDGCTPLQDTAYIAITVKDALKVKLNTTDTLICYNKTAAVSAAGSGGNAGSYIYTWNHALGTGSSKMSSLTANTWLKVTLTDGCTVSPASDSVLITVRPALKVSLGKDTSLCRGNTYNLQANASGGDAKAYSFQWNQGLPSQSSHSVSPASTTAYIVRLKDACSDDAVDTITVDLKSALDIQFPKDSTICSGQSVVLSAIAGGGKTGAYQYQWNNGLGNAASHQVTPASTTTYTVVLSDGCTKLNDTASVIVAVRDPLVAKIVAQDTMVCYNKSTKLTVSGNGGDAKAYVFSWDKGLGQGSVKNTVQLVANMMFRVTLTDACTVNPAMDSIWIKVRNPLTVDLGNDTQICKGTDVTVLASTNGGDASKYSYQWTQGLVNAVSHAVNPKVKTMYKVVVSDQCSDNAEDSVVIDVLPGLALTGLNDTTICYGGTAVLEPVAAGGKPADYIYTWDHGLGNAAKQSVSPVSTTSYQLELKDQCTDPSALTSVTVTVRPALALSFALDKQAVCVGDSAKLTVSLGGGMPSQYQWLLNGNANNNSTVYLKPGANILYNIKLRDNCSSDKDTSFTMTVNPLPVVDFTTADTLVCSGRTVQFNNLSSGAVNYEWTFGATGSSKATSPSYVFNTLGVFPVSLTAISAASCRNSNTKNNYIRVNQMPETDFAVSSPAVFYDHPEISFNNQSRNYTAFEWSFGDATKESGAMTPTHRYADTGKYTVTLVSWNGPGCSDTMNIPVTVKDIYRLFIPTAISVNDDYINEQLLIGGRGIQSYHLAIYNRWGQEVYSGNQNDKAFDGRDASNRQLPKGSYLLVAEVKDFDGKMHYIRQVLQVL